MKMSTEVAFQYRHKKFDHRKRSREEELNSSENDTCSPLTDGDSSIVSDKWSSVKNSGQKIESRISTDHELQEEMQLIDLNECRNPSKRRLLHQTNASLICITEPVNSAEGLHKPKKNNHQSFSRNHIKAEPGASLPIRIKEELIQLNAVLPEIPLETYEEICKFRSNMVRKFPKKERTAKEQERRDKNTFACRKSRRVKKIEQVAIEEEYKGYKDTHLQLTEYAIRAAAYFKELMNMTQAAVSDVIVID